MDLTKLGRTERVLAVVGLLAFIDTFLPWWSVSAKGSIAALAGSGASANGNAWDIGFWAWFPMVLLLAVGVLVALPAFGRAVVIRGGYAAFGAVALLSTIILLILWLTYSPIPSELSAYVDSSASFGTYLAVVLAIVATAFSYLGFTAAGGTLNKFGDAFKAQPPQAAAYVPPAGGYAAPPSFGAPPADPPAPGTWQQPPQQ
jgi:hypothetical protein